MNMFDKAAIAKLDVLDHLAHSTCYSLGEITHNDHLIGLELDVSKNEDETPGILASCDTEGVDMREMMTQDLTDKIIEHARSLGLSVQTIVWDGRDEQWSELICGQLVLGVIRSEDQLELAV